MLTRLTAGISRYMTEKGVCAPEQTEIIAYGMLRLFMDIIQIAVLAVAALVFRVIPAMLALSVFYAVLRGYIGGIHANSHLKCLTVYTLIALAAALTGTYFPIGYARLAAAALAVFAVIVVYLRAPIVHKDTHKRQAALAKYKKLGRIVVTVEFITVAGFCLTHAEWAWRLGLCAGLGSGIVALTILLPFPSYVKGGVP